METTQSDIPKLRFPEFKGDWKTKRIESVFKEFKSGNSITSARIAEIGKYPVYGGNGLRGYTDNYTHEGFYLLVGRQGALCGNINRTNGKAFISEHAIAGKSNETSDTEWLAQRLGYYNLNRLSESSAQPGLSVAKLLRFKLTIPSLPEQQKIAQFLSSVDAKIEQLSKKKNLLEQYKKGVMQQIFSQKLRFRDENGNNYPEWVEEAIGKYINIKSGQSPSKYKLHDKGKIPFIKVEELNNCKKYQVESRFYSETSKGFIKPNSIIFPKRGAAILTNKVRINISPILIDSNLMAIIPNVEFIGYEFLYYLITYLKLYKIADTSTIPQINNKHIFEIFMLRPAIQEQTQIATFLSALDRKIELVNTQLKNTQAFKKGLLQQMFV